MENYDSLFSPKEANQAGPSPPFDKNAWAEKKKAERQMVYNLIDEMVAGMMQGGDLLKTSLDVMARFDRYSVGNVLLIAAQRPGATKLADFETWKKSGAYVQKGENHIKLLEPGEEFRREDGSRGMAYNVKHVFDISQTSAKNPVSKVQYDTRLLLKAMLNNAPCPVEISEQVSDSVGAVYHPDERKIYVRPGMSGSNLFQYLARELSRAHMDRGNNHDQSRHTFAAYCAAYILCSRYHVDTQSFNFAVPTDNMEAQDLRAELEKARDCANQISVDMSNVLERSSRHHDREAY